MKKKGKKNEGFEIKFLWFSDDINTNLEMKTLYPNNHKLDVKHVPPTERELYVRLDSDEKIAFVNYHPMHKLFASSFPPHPLNPPPSKNQKERGKKKLYIVILLAFSSQELKS